MKLVNPNYLSNKEKRILLFKNSINNLLAQIPTNQEFVTVAEVRSYFLDNSVLDITGIPVKLNVLTDENIMLFMAMSDVKVVD
jgi:hypothetical protein